MEIKVKAIEAGFGEELLEESLEYLVELCEDKDTGSLQEEIESCFDFDTFETRPDAEDYEKLIEWVAKEYGL